MAELLAATRVGAGDATRSLVMLHGIYGRSRNWQAIARSLVDERPEYACWLVDLPGHGDSGPGAHGDTVTGLAADVAAWLDASGLGPDAILGHSFGGKVALAVAASRRTRRMQVWIVDSTPATGEPSGDAWRMLQSVRRLPPRFESREQLVAALTGDGWSQGVAQWMATNLTRAPEGFVWRLDFHAMERLLHSFYSTDLWPAIEDAPLNQDFHFIKASKSNTMSAAAVRRAESFDPARVAVHHRTGGHWIHAESPAMVVELLAERLP